MLVTIAINIIRGCEYTRTIVIYPKHANTLIMIIRINYYIRQRKGSLCEIVFLY